VRTIIVEKGKELVKSIQEEGRKYVSSTPIKPGGNHEGGKSDVGTDSDRRNKGKGQTRCGRRKESPGGEKSWGYVGEAVLPKGRREKQQSKIEGGKNN